MKRIVFTNLFFLFAFALLFQSCSKDSKDMPQPETPNEKGKLQSDIVGKWIIQSSSGRTTADEAFLEFLSDSTFLVYNVSQTLATGKFNAISATEISLDKFGSIKEIKISQDKISLKLTYSAKTLTITANKSAAVDTSDKTKLLSHLWSLTADQDGASILTNNSQWEKPVDKVTFLFTSSGTYLAQIFSKGEVFESQTINWKWHSTKSDRLVFWTMGSTLNEERDYVIIRELTTSTLKTLEYHKDDNGVDQPANYVFKRL
ncbi:hypothetical protein [Dyadobacter psychrotolerans]|uniref:Lipocalin-like domain-containing protein n=1 Tax=Dyadobacter psychrotolerans TaxID=2541721 RepID=A0A4V2Z2C4_9BACT|nr:hypothetical protein [Dyadobacter psychrotolerans]TDE08288.1 hypothetical protein E0F88_32835 [Dyadobacter psychrotolerans]